MSSNKKSLGSLILLLLVFLAIAGASWFYFSSQNQEGMEGREATKIVESSQEMDMTTSESADNIDPHGHAHPTEANAIGQKGTIHELSIKPKLGRRGVGDPNAPIQIQEFFSLTCNHCAAFHTGTYQELKDKYINTGKVYFIYEEFPLNGPALYGSMIARCLPEERYAGFIDILLRNQESWAFSGDFKASLQQNAKLAGMSEEEFETCFNDKELQKAIAENIKEASDVWKISSTPSFVVNNGERVMSGGQPLENFEKVFNELTGNTEQE